MKRFKKFKQLTKVLALVLALSCVTTVLPILPASITAEAATIKLNKQEFVINKGNTTSLKLKGTKEDVVWKSNKPSVAKVNANGLVTAKKPGKAKITAKVKGSSKKYTCAVTVENPHFEHSAIEVPLNYGTDLHLKGTTQKAKWSSSNKNIVTVSAYGVIFGKALGTATITAKVNGYKFQCPVTVVASGNSGDDGDEQDPEQTHPSQPEFSLSPTTLEMEQSGTVTLTYTGKGRLITVNSNSSICSYSWGQWTGNTIPLNITGKKAGTATITITNTEDNRSVSVTVHVNLYAKTVTLSSNAETINIGDEIKLTATVEPSYAKQDVDWSSNNEQVAKVSYLGEVEGISEGQATITATSEDGKASAQCVVTVNNPVKITGPELPITVYEYDSNGSVVTSCKLTSMKFETERISSGYRCTMHVEGEKIDDKKGSTSTAACKINYRVLKADDNSVVTSGRFTTPELKIGERFTKETDNIVVKEPGNYKLELTDTSTSSKPNNPPDTDDPTSPDVPSGLEGRELLMAAYGVNAAYNGSKFPSTLRLNRVTCQHNVTTGYGDNISRMVLRCYAQNSLGGYGEIYVVVIACESNEHYANATYEPRIGAYIRATIYSSDPGMENGAVFSNKKAVDAYNQYLGDTYGRKNIPYD